MHLLYQSSGIVYPISFSISFLRRLPDTELKVTSRPIFVSRCITVTCLLFLWTCIRHENVMKALVIYAFFLKMLTVALYYLHTSRTDVNIALLLRVSSFNNIQ